MKKRVLSLLTAAVLITGNLLMGQAFAAGESSPYIKLEADKSTANIGQVVKVSVKVKDIKNLSGFQVSIKYDQAKLKAVDPDTGAELTDDLLPKTGDILTKKQFNPLEVGSNKIKEGLLDFGRSYLNLTKYKDSKSPESTGTLAIIGFKVIKKEAANIKFENSDSMPAAINGTMLFDWDGSQIKSGYTISQQISINSGSGNSNNTGSETNTNSGSGSATDDISSHWAKASIKKLVGLGVVSGYPDGSFKPNNQVNRAEITKIISKAAKLEEAPNPDLDFADASKIPGWVKGYLKKAVEKGIIKGYADGSFKPGNKVSRQELVVMVMRAFDLGESSQDLTFSDAGSIPAWAKGYFAKAVELGIVGGYKDNTIKPGKNITRAEACTIIMKCLDMKN